jgi:hypothetical protein
LIASTWLFSSAAAGPYSTAFWSKTATPGLTAVSLKMETTFGAAPRMHSAAKASVSREAAALKPAPVRSKSRVMRYLLLAALPLNAQCSSRCVAPAVYGVSCLLPAPTYTPIAATAPPLSWLATRTPFASVVTVVGPGAGGARSDGGAMPGSADVIGTTGSNAPCATFHSIDGWAARARDGAAAERVRAARSVDSIATGGSGSGVAQPAPRSACSACRSLRPARRPQPPRQSIGF